MKWPEVRKLLQVTAVTLSHYVKEWKIRITQKFDWSHYIYNDEDVYNMIWKKLENLLSMLESLQINNLKI